MSHFAGVSEGAAGMEDPSLHLQLEESQSETHYLSCMHGAL